MSGFLKRNKQVIIYGISLAILLFLMRWLELRLIIFNHAFEIYAAIIAMMFTVLGIWLAIKLMNPGVKVVEQIVEKVYPAQNSPIFTLNEEAFEASGLSKRELDVLQLMDSGLSNQEMAARLFVSLNTIKTHISKIFEKLEVNRRTQAVEKARRLGLIP
jgi:DNA-binding CsgD family transcriptional regulator